MPRFLDRIFDLEPSDDPRRVPVGVQAQGKGQTIQSTPGARVRLPREDRDAQAQLALLWCLRNGTPVELHASTANILLDGAPVTLRSLTAQLGKKR